MENVSVRKAIVHILDSAHEEPVLNDFLLELDDEVSDFLESHIRRSLRDEEAKTAKFEQGRNIVKETCEEMIENVDRDDIFINGTKDIARHLFRFIKTNIDIPSCDLVVTCFETECGFFISMLKLDYTRTYIHNMEFLDGKFRISIVPQLIGLPSAGQRLQKCAFVGGPDIDPQVLFLDKGNKDAGEGLDFFSRSFLQCLSEPDAAEKTKRLKNAAEEWTRKNLKDDAAMAEEVRSAFRKAIKKAEPVDVEEVAKSALKMEPELRESLIEHFETREVSGTVEIDPRWVEDRVKKVRITTDSGISVAIPAELYEDSSVFRVEKNINGTLDLRILGIKHYKQS